eukprot:3823360-Amphidinium_carterae.1
MFDRRNNNPKPKAMLYYDDLRAFIFAYLDAFLAKLDLNLSSLFVDTLGCCFLGVDIRIGLGGCCLGPKNIRTYWTPLKEVRVYIHQFMTNTSGTVRVPAGV